MQQKNSDQSTFTYQTRIKHNECTDEVLSCFAILMGKVERYVFAEFAKGRSISSLKSFCLQRFSITARHFNSIRVTLEGKIASSKEGQKNRLKNLGYQIASLEKTIQKLQKKKDVDFILHQKKRRLACLRSRAGSIERDLKNGVVHLCFGSKKLFHEQFDLSANGYSSHEEWKKEWRSARSKNIFLLGSKDETGGNQSATALIQEDGLISLRIRLPDALSHFGKYHVLSDLYFAYGHEQIVNAIRQCLERKKDGTSGVAISYRLFRDKKGWRIFVSVPTLKPKSASQNGIGVIGIDINSDHIAVVETDRFGNPFSHRRLPLVTYGKTHHQAKAHIGDVVKEIVSWGYSTTKPLVIEELSFEKKKQELRETGAPRYSRMLSSFAYGAFISGLRSRGFRFGVEVKEVNPAFTSIIGRAKFSKRYGLSIHESAALCIGRRFLGVSENLPRFFGAIADGKGGFVALPLPVRNRGEHVWSAWRRVKKKLPAVLAAHFRAQSMRSSGLSTCCDTKKVLDFVSEILTREPTTALLGCRV
jgi:IS605 OrfB family transposase